ncbi:exopolygalacturonase clone GBGE184 [Sesamum indicum]|uniref:Exopolygalacturonase clone GBGE184 n=1 Tax=Sesamum indicum TaxID=4182 RepID=A0A6I9TC68_SESIN|nr:exopolygalacturonase clone GBGE184 [Sesamum indicum]
MVNPGGGRGTVEACLVLGIACLLALSGVRCDQLLHPPRRLGGEAVFDVTKFGAVADGSTDSAIALIRAWKAACNSNGAAKLLIPRGEFAAGEVLFTGPCIAKKPITIEIQGNLLAYEDPSAYTGGAWIMLEKVDGAVLKGGGTINGRGKMLWQYAETKDGPPLPVSFVFQTVQNAQMSNLNFVDSMGFHVKVTDSSNVDIKNIKIRAPGKSPNTDGIHLSSAINVNITDSIIGTGDDCVSIGHGTYNILVARIICGPGHGLSVGSLGKRPTETNLKGLTIINCTLVGTTNGARIKTYHASPRIQATSILFQDILMERVKNPIIIDQHYDSKRRPEQSSVKLSDIHFRNIRGSTISKVPVKLNCSSMFPCQGVELADINLTPFGPIGPLTSACSNAKFFIRGKLNPPAPVCK